MLIRSILKLHDCTLKCSYLAHCKLILSVVKSLRIHLLLNHQNEDLASVSQSATKKSNSNISPLRYDRDKFKSISMMMRTRRRMKKRRLRRTSRIMRRSIRRTIKRRTMTNLHFGGLEETWLSDTLKDLKISLPCAK